MNRLIASTAIVLALGFAPALAADQPGSADTSTGAAEQSSAPPNSDAAKMKSADQPTPSSGQADSSGGAAEQSSAPPKSSAAETNKPNPTLGMQPGSTPNTQPE